MIDDILGRLAAGQNLGMKEMASAIDAMMEGRCSTGQIGLFLTTLRAKGETVEEIAGAAAAMRRHMVSIRSPHAELVDTCGTGGDDSGTFNISTAAALVTAAAGVPVAKHGNRRVTSKTGSADVLAELGVNIEADVRQVEACLGKVGICFCFAPLMHPAMKQVADVRRELGVPTVFNLLGPLTNPASAPYQLIGVGRAELRDTLAQALALLGTRRALVVHGSDGLDEITLAGPTYVTEVHGPGGAGGQRITESIWAPADFGLSAGKLDKLVVQTPGESAAMIRGVLDGEEGPARDIVLLNAAAALLVAGVAPDRPAAAEQAADAIDSGTAARVLDRLVEVSHG